MARLDAVTISAVVDFVAGSVESAGAELATRNMNTTIAMVPMRATPAIPTGVNTA